jgi:hypothetical protein
LSLRFDDLDSAVVGYPENDHWQLVLSIETTPMFLGGLRKLENHGQRIHLGFGGMWSSIEM